MANIKLVCPHCGQSFECPKPYRGRQIVCLECKQLLPISRGSARKWLLGFLGLAILLFALMAWILCPANFHWPDRRPIGVLFLASDHHSSSVNPRGWFNDDTLDVTSAGGSERFQKALFDYGDRSIAILKKTGAQGMIVWDVEGEQYPHKTTFIGDPRLLDKLAPEMAPVADEFFKRFRDAGLKVGVTIRPQQLVFENGVPRQTTVADIERVLLAKIDYAQAHWGATMFYIDSNDGLWRPDEVLQLRCLEARRQGILLIPEHHYFPYRAFSAPYVSWRKGKPATVGWLTRRLFPNSFDVVDISDVPEDDVAAARHAGDIPLFRAWFWNPDCDTVQKLQPAQP